MDKPYFFPSQPPFPWFNTPYKIVKESHFLWKADDWNYDIVKTIMQKMFKYPPCQAVLSKSGNH